MSYVPVVWLNFIFYRENRKLREIVSGQGGTGSNTTVGHFTSSPHSSYQRAITTQRSSPHVSTEGLPVSKDIWVCILTIESLFLKILLFYEEYYCILDLALAFWLFSYNFFSLLQSKLRCLLEDQESALAVSLWWRPLRGAQGPHKAPPTIRMLHQPSMSRVVGPPILASMLLRRSTKPWVRSRPRLSSCLQVVWCKHQQALVGTCSLLDMCADAFPSQG